MVNAGDIVQINIDQGYCDSMVSKYMPPPHDNLDTRMFAVLYVDGVFNERGIVVADGYGVSPPMAKRLSMVSEMALGALSSCRCGCFAT